MGKTLEAIGDALALLSGVFLIGLVFIIAYKYARYYWLVFKSRNDKAAIILRVMGLKGSFKEITMENYYGLRVKINDKTFYPEQKGEMKRLKKHLKGSVLEEKKIIDK